MFVHKFADQVYHAGTWHVQLCGDKVWVIRPNAHGQWPAGSPPALARGLIILITLITRITLITLLGLERLRVVVQEGDMLLINTRLWFHSTVCGVVYVHAI